MNVAIFVFDEIQILDFTGPMDVFATDEQRFKPYTVGQFKKPVTTFGGLSINPTYDFQDAPPADILIIPGGTVNAELEKAEVIDWIGRSAQKAKHVLSICTGAFLVGKAGLLKGKTTTTYHTRLERLRHFGDHFDVVGDQRFVDNGDMICAAGISSGIDASFYLVEKIYGIGVAQQIALDLEFDWQPHSGYARAAFADLRFPRLTWPVGSQQRIIRTQGDRQTWDMEAEVMLAEPLDQPMDYFHQQLKQAYCANLKQVQAEKLLLFQWQQRHNTRNEYGELRINFETETKLHYGLKLQPTSPE